jgi:phosphoribosylglycinamide formyltransferase-1
MLRIAFLCSGSGGNLRFMAEAIRLGWIENAMICGVISDRECLANQFARENNIKTKEIDFSGQGQLYLIEELNHLAPTIIITNVHKILLPAVVDAFKGVLVNLHYSILPAFGGVIGTKPVSLALDYGALFVGVTVHLVNNLVDMGKPLVQAVIPVESGDTTENLMDIVFRCGGISLLNGVQILRSGGCQGDQAGNKCLKIYGRTVFINPMILYSLDFEVENFWQQLKSYPSDVI